MDNYMKLQIPAIGENESFARNAVSAFALLCSPTVEEINDIKTAVSEAVTNAVVHAYGDEGGIVEISACIAEGVLEVTVKDSGCGIPNVEEAKEPFFTTKPDDERSGMGFTIMSTFMDEVDVASAPGEGTSVTMRKKFAGC